MEAIEVPGMMVVPAVADVPPLEVRALPVLFVLVFV